MLRQIIDDDELIPLINPLWIYINDNYSCHIL